MASRPIVPFQQKAKGEEVVGGRKQQKNAAGDGKNRKALGDIGNLDHVKGVEIKPNRPITRSFCAQLLANAQAAAAAKNNKKLAIPNVADPKPNVADGVVAKRVAPKPAEKKVTAKPKAQEVIEINPAEEAQKNKSVNKKKEGGENKKKSRTLTSVLTARSKNENRPHQYMDSQPDINEKMRAILVDWLINVHTKFDLSLETLYLTINIIDRFLSVKTVPREELQLVGISAMLMASKYEEIWPPEVDEFVCLSDRAFIHEEILAMEKIILGKLEWI
ncbi:unnamed protein product [Lupinus luteus]|uniref:B-like cyclin n=1 Tax=Lupinus luteus TaxID=3873 RepID=A0AAV1YFN4_LUPLU